MGDVVWVALIAAVPGTISAIAAISAARKSQKSLEQSRMNTEKIAEVHTLANNNLAAANSRLDTALEKIDHLQEAKG
jgi:hypothetical protein